MGCLRVVHPDHPAWLRPEPSRLHARRHSARQHELRRHQRPADHPRDHQRQHQHGGTGAGRRCAGYGIQLQPRRHHPVLLGRPGQRGRRARQPDVRLRQHPPQLRAAGYRRLQRLLDVSVVRPRRYRQMEGLRRPEIGPDQPEERLPVGRRQPHQPVRRRFQAQGIRLPGSVADQPARAGLELRLLAAGLGAGRAGGQCDRGQGSLSRLVERSAGGLRQGRRELLRRRRHPPRQAGGLERLVQPRRQYHAERGRVQPRRPWRRAVGHAVPGLVAHRADRHAHHRLRPRPHRRHRLAAVRAGQQRDRAWRVGRKRQQQPGAQLFRAERPVHLSQRFLRKRGADGARLLPELRHHHPHGLRGRHHPPAG